MFFKWNHNIKLKTIVRNAWDHFPLLVMSDTQGQLHQFVFILSIFVYKYASIFIDNVYITVLCFYFDFIYCFII